MPAWLIPAISAAGSAVQAYLNRQQKTEMELSPEAKEYLRRLYGEMGRATAPGYVTRPIEKAFAGLRTDIRENIGESLGPGSGLETAKLFQARTEEGRLVGEATEKYRADLLRQIGGVVGGGGVQTTTMPPDIGPMGGDIGWLLWALTQGKGKKPSGEAEKGTYWPGRGEGWLSLLGR